MLEKLNVICKRVANCYRYYLNRFQNNILLYRIYIYIYICTKIRHLVLIWGFKT